MTTEPENITSPYATPATDPLMPSSATGIAAEATLGSRIGGYIIDVIVVMLISFVVTFILTKISPSLGILGAFIAMIYFLVRDNLMGGQSIGKKVVKIRAVTEDGRTLAGNWGPGLIRNAVLFIPLFPLIELIILATKNGKPGGLRRLGDEWGKTKVVVAG